MDVSSGSSYVAISNRSPYDLSFLPGVFWIWVLVIFGHGGYVCVYIYYLAFLLCLQSYEIQFGRHSLL